MLRHSYATWALNHGMNPIMLAQVLGHSSLVMIQRNYAHSTPADAHETLAKLLSAD
jgi:integrase